jgi:NADPH-dependent 2,4-dienoyl-CoA reductase/sulfur reductase-like enzyme/nitrite reductase/ring-hydroxylating ferredoxin subunit
MGGTVELAGPDLRQGIGINDVADGGLLLGHADGEPVVVHRRGDEFFALGAVCTHYSGPLAEGLVVGDTLRCPWHHACYDIRTGQVKGAPAMSDVSAWELERRGDRVFVVGRKASPPRPEAKGPASVVVIGGGAAGERTAETLRREGYKGHVTIVDAGEDLPFDKPNLSKDYLAGNAPEEWIPLRPADFYAEHHIALRLGWRVTEIDTSAHRVTLDDGSHIPYGTLVIATGAAPIRLPEAVARGAVHYLRTFADSKAIIEASASAKRAVVIGASFIGLEVAASLRARGLDVDVVAPEAIPLERVLGHELGMFVRSLHEQHGVVFHLGETVQSIEAGEVLLSSGSRLQADLVVAGIGVRPVTDLAERAGITVDNGIVVDEYLQTNVPHVYAAGDLARWPLRPGGERMRVEHWVVAQRQGAHVARHILGQRTPFIDVPFFWSAHYDVVIAYVGYGLPWDRLDIDGSIEARDCTVRYYRGNEVIGAATIFRDRDSLTIEAELEQRLKKALEPALA